MINFSNKFSFRKGLYLKENHISWKSEAPLYSEKNLNPILPYDSLHINSLQCLRRSVIISLICHCRRMMIEKIASHLADFSPRVHSNTRALYQYCPIPLVNYPQLENELFCNIYYLRHLCDTTKFPDWPIKEPVSTQNYCLIFRKCVGILTRVREIRRTRRTCPANFEKCPAKSCS